MMKMLMFSFALFLSHLVSCEEEMGNISYIDCVDQAPSEITSFTCFMKNDNNTDWKYDEVNPPAPQVKWHEVEYEVSDHYLILNLTWQMNAYKVMHTVNGFILELDHNNIKLVEKVLRLAGKKYMKHADHSQQIFFTTVVVIDRAKLQRLETIDMKIQGFPRKRISISNYDFGSLDLWDILPPTTWPPEEITQVIMKGPVILDSHASRYHHISIMIGCVVFVCVITAVVVRYNCSSSENSPSSQQPILVLVRTTGFPSGKSPATTGIFRTERSPYWGFVSRFATILLEADLDVHCNLWDMVAQQGSAENWLSERLECVKEIILFEIPRHDWDEDDDVYSLMVRSIAENRFRDRVLVKVVHWGNSVPSAVGRKNLQFFQLPDKLGQLLSSVVKKQIEKNSRESLTRDLQDMLIEISSSSEGKFP